MLGIGWTEMMVIGVVALIVIGPKELPALMQKVGRSVGAIRRMASEFQREINRSTGLDTVKDLRRTIADPLKKTTTEIAREFNRTTSGGSTEPSGAIKPADPKAQSVVKEIEAKAGLSTPPEPSKTGPVKAAVNSSQPPDDLMKPLSPPKTPAAPPAGPPPASLQLPPGTPKTPRKRATVTSQAQAGAPDAAQPTKPARRRTPAKPKTPQAEV